MVSTIEESINLLRADGCGMPRSSARKSRAPNIGHNVPLSIQNLYDEIMGYSSVVQA